MKRILRLAVIGWCVFSVKLAAAETLAIGAAAPVWKELKGVDGRLYSLADFHEAEVLVLAFTCNSCPFATAYEDRFVEFARDYKDRRVSFVAICVNLDEADSLEAMTLRAKEKKFDFPYLKDPTQKIGRDHGAVVTPYLFVFDKERKLAYRGAMDNASKPAKVTERYVRNAVDALLSGKAVPVSETKAAGCRIPYE